MTMNDSPLLGLATTEELFRELIARFSTQLMIDKALKLAEMLGELYAIDREYRTVDHD